MKRHESQRGYFAYELYKRMKRNKKIWLLTGDLGYKVFDDIREEFPDRFVNCGAAEQAMMGVAVGLAQEGKIVFCYTITSFFLRAAETINIYLHNERLPIKLVGSGRDRDYAHDGYSHDAGVAQNYLHELNIKEYYPETKEEIPGMVSSMMKDTLPSFISLRR